VQAVKMNIILQQPEIPGAIKTMMEQNVLFAVLAVIIFVLAYFSWYILKRHLKKLEDEAEQTKVLNEIRDELKIIKAKIER
jgi:large-conductance mechanosensitive channel